MNQITPAVCRTLLTEQDVNLQIYHDAMVAFTSNLPLIEELANLDCWNSEHDPILELTEWLLRESTFGGNKK